MQHQGSGQASQGGTMTSGGQSGQMPTGGQGAGTFGQGGASGGQGSGGFQGAGNFGSPGAGMQGFPGRFGQGFQVTGNYPEGYLFNGTGWQGQRWTSSQANWQTPGPHTGKGPQGYQRSNERIKEDVNERLTQHGQLDASGINVQVKDGEVTLTGAVDSRQAKRTAEDVADSVSGVKDVHNELKVQHGQQGQSSGSQQGQRSKTAAGSNA